MARAGRPQFVTLLVVPHCGRRTYQIRASVSFLRGLAGAGALLVVVLAIFLRSYVFMRGNMAELRQLQAKAAAHQRALDALAGQASVAEEREKRVAALEAGVRSLIEQDRYLPAHLRTRLLSVLGEGVTPSRGGGGPAPEGPAGETGMGGGDTEPGRPRAGPLTSRGSDKRWVIQSYTETAQVLAGELDRAVTLGTTAADRLEVLERTLRMRQEMLSALPQSWPVQGSYTSGFGYRRSPFGRGREFHSGVDLAAPSGSPVRAAAGGVVSFAGWKPGLGRTLVIDHGFGISTLYGHNSQLLAEAGERVSAGQVVARVGSTGRSTGSHLHFELHFWGAAQDPWPYLRRLSGR